MHISLLMYGSVTISPLFSFSLTLFLLPLYLSINEILLIKQQHMLLGASQRLRLLASPACSTSSDGSLSLRILLGYSYGQTFRDDGNESSNVQRATAFPSTI